MWRQDPNPRSPARNGHKLARILWRLVVNRPVRRPRITGCNFGAQAPTPANEDRLTASGKEEFSGHLSRKGHRLLRTDHQVHSVHLTAGMLGEWWAVAGAIECRGKEVYFKVDAEE